MLFFVVVYSSYILLFFPQCACSQLHFFYNRIPSCEEELSADDVSSDTLASIKECASRKEEEMKKSDFTKEFVSTGIYSDANGYLHFYLQPDEMEKCKQQFENDINNSIDSVFSFYNQCYETP